MSNDGFYDENGQQTKRAVRTTKQFWLYVRRIFRRAKTPREVMDLQRVLDGDVSVTASLRLLDLMCKPQKKQKVQR